MLKNFQRIIRHLLELAIREDYPLLQDSTYFSTAEQNGDESASRLLNAAFLIALGGKDHPQAGEAKQYLQRKSRQQDWENIAGFYLDAIQAVENEINSLPENDPETAKRLEVLSKQLETPQELEIGQQQIEIFWSFFHPEATDIWGQEESRVAALREKRKVRITELNPTPLTNPAGQVLFTSNVLLTLPSVHDSLDALQLENGLEGKLAMVRDEPQRYWYDHPIQIGVEPENNEVLYGLRGLQEALDYERQQGNLGEQEQLTCVLSVSVTHTGLHGLAREYLTNELRRGKPLPGMNIFVFTEDDSQQLIKEVLAAAARYYLGEEQADEKLRMFGVDGEYGRHYTFLKAIAAFWNVLIDPQIKATFKIDLDQVFPQEILKAETGLSAFEHLKSPLWGASGLDVSGKPVELGMIAGALVNEDDIHQDLFSPDVPFPPSDRDFSPDQWVFFSQLPQALSTEAEMMARYDIVDLDGENTCLQRIHVTGGTNGILVDSLMRYRPFTPSFIGRAEDQAYILSTMDEPGIRLAYLHQSGLIMRHDKQAFAQEAIQAAQVGKLIGDYVRILYFSAYARALASDIHKIKDRCDPFTGSFISHIPTTLTLIRFALKAEALFEAGDSQLGVDFLKLGSQRISQALEFTSSQIRRQYLEERQGWVLFYETLLALKRGLREGDRFAEDIRRKAAEIIGELMIRIDN